MGFPRFNIGSRFNTVSTSANTLYRSFSFSSNKIINTIHKFSVIGVSRSVTTVNAASSLLAKVSSSITCTATCNAIPITQYTVNPDDITCSATVTAECEAHSIVKCTAVCNAPSKVIVRSEFVSEGKAYCAARPTNDAELYIAASDSSIEDKMFAFYICSGTQDQIAINSLANRGKKLWFAAGVYHCDADINFKDIDIQGAGSGKTFFDFTTKNTSPLFVPDIGMNIRIKGSDSVNKSINIMNFSVTGSGIIHIVYDDPLYYTSWDTKIILTDIEATNYNYNGLLYRNTSTLGKIMVEIAYPITNYKPVYMGPAFLSLINCKVHDVDTSGYYIFGDTNNIKPARAFYDIYISNCSAERCGKREIGSVIAGFNLLNNLSANNIRISNSIANDNWHAGFYFDDTHTRYYLETKQSNTVYDIYMDNCQAYMNGMRSKNNVPVEMIPYCSGFVLREVDMGDGVYVGIPHSPDENIFYARDPFWFRGNGLGAHYIITSWSDYAIIAYGDIINCTSSNNRYAGFYSRGYAWNRASLNFNGCLSSDCKYAFAIDTHNGINFINCVSHNIPAPSIMLKNIAYINIQYMRIDDSVDAQYITFDSMEDLYNLPLPAFKFIEVVN